MWHKTRLFPYHKKTNITQFSEEINLKQSDNWDCNGSDGQSSTCWLYYLTYLAEVKELNVQVVFAWAIQQLYLSKSQIKANDQLKWSKQRCV